MGAMPSTLRSRRGASVAPEPIEQPLLSDQLDQQAVPISLRRTAAEQRELPWPLSAVVAAARSVFHALSFAWHSLVGEWELQPALPAAVQSQSPAFQ